MVGSLKNINITHKLYCYCPNSNRVVSYGQNFDRAYFPLHQEAKKLFTWKTIQKHIFKPFHVHLWIDFNFFDWFFNKQITCSKPNLPDTGQYYVPYETLNGAYTTVS